MIIKKIPSVLIAITVAVVTAGCGDQQGDQQPAGQLTAGSSTISSSSTTLRPPSATGTGAPSSSTTAAAVNPQPGQTRCSAAVLRGNVQLGDPAAGNRYARLIVTNTGRAECTLYGYGGFQLINASGAPLPTRTLRDEPPRPTLVRLAPSATAAKTLHWGVVPAGNDPVEGPCQPEPSGARVIPPDETEPFTVDWQFGPVCGGGTIHDSAYYLQ